MPRLRKPTLEQDARNRAIRSFIQGLAVDVAVAIAVAVYGWTTSHEAFVWKLQLIALGKTVAQTVASYVMRRFVDPSRIPTPLPPEPVPEPADDGAPTA